MEVLVNLLTLVTNMDHDRVLGTAPGLLSPLPFLGWLGAAGTAAHSAAPVVVVGAAPVGGAALLARYLVRHDDVTGRRVMSFSIFLHKKCWRQQNPSFFE